MNKDITFSIYDSKLFQITANYTFLEIRNSDECSIYPKLSQINAKHSGINYPVMYNFENENFIMKLSHLLEIFF